VGKAQSFVKVAGQGGERGVVGEPLEKFAYVSNPERALEAGADVL